jgi:type II secretory pathway pseudopilin PulG
MSSLQPRQKRQRGFTLIELAVVALVGIVLTALAVPKISEYIISGRVPAAGRDLIKAINRLNQLANLTQSTSPYLTLLSNDQLFTDSNFVVVGTVIRHGLGATSGEIYLTSLLTGTAFAVTVWGLDAATCPSLASVMSKASTAIEVSTSGTAATPTAPAAPTDVPTVTSATVVKTLTSSYNSAAARSACSSAGQFNYMRFYITK